MSPNLVYFAAGAEEHAKRIKRLLKVQEGDHSLFQATDDLRTADVVVSSAWLNATVPVVSWRWAKACCINNKYAETKAFLVKRDSTSQSSPAKGAQNSADSTPSPSQNALSTFGQTTEDSHDMNKSISSSTIPPSGSIQKTSDDKSSVKATTTPPRPSTPTPAKNASNTASKPNHFSNTTELAASKLTAPKVTVPLSLPTHKAAASPKPPQGSIQKEKKQATAKSTSAKLAPVSSSLVDSDMSSSESEDHEAPSTKASVQKKTGVATKLKPIAPIQPRSALSKSSKPAPKSTAPVNPPAAPVVSSTARTTRSSKTTKGKTTGASRAVTIEPANNAMSITEPITQELEISSSLHKQKEDSDADSYAMELDEPEIELPQPKTKRKKRHPRREPSHMEIEEGEGDNWINNGSEDSETLAEPPKAKRPKKKEIEEEVHASTPTASEDEEFLEEEETDTDPGDSDEEPHTLPSRSTRTVNSGARAKSEPRKQKKRAPRSPKSETDSTEDPAVQIPRRLEIRMTKKMTEPLFPKRRTAAWTRIYMSGLKGTALDFAMHELSDLNMLYTTITKDLREASHVVLPDPPLRTVSVLQAITQGKWILTRAWFDHIKKKREKPSEEKFEVVAWKGAKRSRIEHAEYLAENPDWVYDPAGDPSPIGPFLGLSLNTSALDLQQQRVAAELIHAAGGTTTARGKIQVIPRDAVAVDRVAQDEESTDYEDDEEEGIEEERPKAKSSKSSKPKRRKKPKKDYVDDPGDHLPKRRKIQRLHNATVVYWDYILDCIEAWELLNYETWASVQM